MLNDKSLISAGIYVNHVRCAGRSRALHSENESPNWDDLDSLRLSRLGSSGAPGCLLGMGS